MTPRPRALARALGACVLAGSSLGTAAGGPHVHGAATLSISTEGPELRVLLEVPMEVLVGFEHAPRTAAERQAAQRARQLLAKPALLQPNPEAGCVAHSSGESVEGTVSRNAGHADLAHEFAFRCARPAQLRSLEIALFDAFPRLHRIDAVVVSAEGQARRTLQRPQRSLRLGR